MTALCYSFIYIFETLISFMYFNNKFTQKVNNILLFASFTISFIIQYSVNFLGIPYINLALFIICNFLICFICYSSKLLQALFNSFLLATIMLITELIIVYIAKIIFSINVTDYTTNEIILIIQSGSAKLLYFLVTYFISKFSTKESRNDLKIAKTVFLILLPISSIIILLGIHNLTEIYTSNDSIYLIFSIVTILLMYSNIIVFWVHESLIKTQKENIDLQLQAQKAEIDTEYYAILQNQYENSNILIHDIKRHLLSIKEFSSEKDYERINKYIDNLYNEYDIKYLKKYSNNKLVNAIVNRYMMSCKDNNINFNCDIRNVDFSFISDNNLTALLDNILENAFDASKTSTEKAIELTIKPVNTNFISINVSNSCAKAPQTKNEMLVTNKENKNLHGVGIKSIKRIAKEYAGHTDYSFDKDKMIFTLKVVLKIN